MSIELSECRDAIRRVGEDIDQLTRSINMLTRHEKLQSYIERATRSIRRRCMSEIDSSEEWRRVRWFDWIRLCEIEVERRALGHSMIDKLD